MALPSIASTTDLAEWLGLEFAAESADEGRAETVLAHASAAVRVEARRQWVDEEGALDGVPEGIPELVVQIAARMWANPTGAEQQTTGPFARRNLANTLTDAEKDAVHAAVRADEGTTSTGGLWTLSTTRGELESRVTLVNVVGQPGEPIEVSSPW